MHTRRFLSGALAAGAGLVLLAALAGCGDTGARGDAAAAVAVRLLSTVRAGDGESACALLAPDTAAELERSSGRSCAEAVGDEELPDPGEVTGVDVNGQWAKVALAADGGDGTVFLAMFHGGWRVVAAGCRPRGERPYDCTLQGG
jgi:hypothetical protein